MKKFLSLVLALVMTMSLVTVSAGAKDFTDSDSITYTEAVDVMSAVKVIDGYADGDFKPTGTLTRGAAAKIICNLILGPTTASALVADAAPYSDVPTTNVFAGYIAYCQKEGIISGYADGTFRPGNSLTGYAFMKMLLGALGYDGEIEGYTGNNWSINVAKRAIAIGLDDDLVGEFNGVKAVNREEACLYAFNTLSADMVEYQAKTSVSTGDTTVVISGSEAKKMANNGKTDVNIDNDGVMQFAEQYFTDLKAVSTTDDFARPATQWKVKAEEIGTYTDTADLTYTAEVDANVIYKDLGLGDDLLVSKGEVVAYRNGEEIADADYADIAKKNDDGSYGANGVLTEVFYDDDKDVATITMIDTYVGTISKTVKATSTRDTYIVIDPEDVHPDDFDGEFETEVEFEDDAYVLYTFSASAEEIKSVTLAEKVEGTAAEVQYKGTDPKTITIDGTKYKASAQVTGDELNSNSVDEDYVLYLDEYGYVIYIEEVEEIGDYALITNMTSEWPNTNKAKLVFSDGTVKTVTTEKDYSGKDGIAPDKIVTYRVNDDGTYTLKKLGVTGTSTGAGFNLVNEKSTIKTSSGAVSADSSTQFVVKDAAETDEWDVYVGSKKAPTITGTDAASLTAYYYVKSGMVKVMFIIPSSMNMVEGASSNKIFISSESRSKHTSNSEGDYYTYEAIVNGEKTTVKVADDATVQTYGRALGANTDGGNAQGWYKSYSTNSKGIITSLKLFSTVNETDSNGEYIVNGIGIDKTKKDYTIKIKNVSGESVTFNVASDVTVFYVNEDGEIATSSYNGIKADDEIFVMGVIDDYLVQSLVLTEDEDVYTNVGGSDDDIYETPEGFVDATVDFKGGTFTANDENIKASVNYDLTKTGKVRSEIQIVIPEYAAGTFNAKVDVYANDKYAETLTVAGGETIDTGNGGKETTYSFNVTGSTEYDASEKLTFKLGELTWTKVDVIYRGAKMVNDSDTVTELNVSSDGTLKWKIDTTDKTPGVVRYSIKGTKNNDTESKTYGSGATANDVLDVGSNVQAEGDQAVIVTILNPEDLTETYSVVKSDLTNDVQSAISASSPAPVTYEKLGVDGATGDEVKFELSQDSGINKGSSVSIEAETTFSAAGPDNMGYAVTLTINGKDYTVEMTKSSATANKIWIENVQSNVVIEKITAKATIKTLAVDTDNVTVSEDGYTVTIAFNEEIGHKNAGNELGTSDFTVRYDGTNNTEVSSMTISGNKVTLRVVDGLISGAKIDISADVAGGGEPTNTFDSTKTVNLSQDNSGKWAAST